MSFHFQLFFFLRLELTEFFGPLAETSCKNKTKQNKKTNKKTMMHRHRPGYGCTHERRLFGAAAPGMLPSASPPAKTTIQGRSPRWVTESSSFKQSGGLISTHPTSCKIWAIALDLSRTWRHSILSNFLSKFSKLLHKEKRLQQLSKSCHRSPCLWFVYMCVSDLLQASVTRLCLR